jgi:hypothetical protein
MKKSTLSQSRNGARSTRCPELHGRRSRRPRAIASRSEGSADYFVREGAFGTNVGRRTCFGLILGALCSVSMASRSHVRAMSIRMDWTRELCSPSAICRHSAARSRHSAAPIIGSCPLVPFDPTPKTSNVCPVADVPVANAADCGSFATPPAGRLALRIASRLAASPTYRPEQGQPFASLKLQQRSQGLRATVCRLPLDS